MIGIIGGSGFYSLLEDAREQEVDTPYGSPSATVALGEISGVEVAFLPRHGHRHQFPPHKVPYRANLWALKNVGVTRVIGPSAVGSLQPHVEPGHFVICDQIVDRTSGREATFHDGPETTHVSFADPYCPAMRAVAFAQARDQGIEVHDRGTVVVIQGPRFSTRAESRWFRDAGWEVINMTQYPEAILARELELCYLNISLVTDYDVGVEGETEPVTHEAVIAMFGRNIEKLRTLLDRIVPALPEERDCPCATALQGARFEA